MTVEQLKLPTPNDLLDEAALIKEARARARRKRVVRSWVATSIAALIGIIAIGTVQNTSPSKNAGVDRRDASATAIECQDARAKLLEVEGLAGGLGNGGVLVRSSVSSARACVMLGYPIVHAKLTSHSSAAASDVRSAYIPGGMTTDAPLPRLSITSRPQVVSFTIQWAIGNGPTCPSVNAIQFTLPGSRAVLTSRSIFQPGFGETKFMGIYCGHLLVTPVVKGSSGSAS
jgi:hypothetical protein